MVRSLLLAEPVVVLFADPFHETPRYMERHLEAPSTLPLCVTARPYRWVGWRPTICRLPRRPLIISVVCVPLPRFRVYTAHASAS